MRWWQWLGLGLFGAGIGCGVAGVLLSPKQVPGAPRQDIGPLPLGLLLAAGILVIVGGRFGLYPFLHRLMTKREVPTWLFLVIMLGLLGAAVAYLVVFHQP
jgi:hypothetical protein